MNKLALTIRFVLFTTFFLAGAGAIVLSILAKPELKEYYESRAALAEIQQQNEKIESLTKQYETLINRIESDPEILQRIIPLTFGHKPHSADTAYPQANNSELQVETEKLIEQIQNAPASNERFPGWLEHVIQPKNRQGLFLAGAGLILITFIFFGTTRGKSID